AKISSERIEELEQKAMQFVTERNETLVNNGVLESKIHKLQRNFDSLTDDFEEYTTKHAESEIGVGEQNEQIAQLEVALKIKEPESEKQGLRSIVDNNKHMLKESESQLFGSDVFNKSTDNDTEMQELNKKIAELE